MKLSKVEIDEQEEAFYKLQDEYFEETDLDKRKEIVWKMYPIFKSAVESAVKKRSNNHFISNMDMIVDDITMTIVKRFIKGQPYKYEYFKTMIWWASMQYYMPKYRETVSLDELYEGSYFKSKSYEMDIDAIIDEVDEELYECRM